MSPEQLLKQVEAEERRQKYGKLKVFLGYASGVGKSFRMLDEGRRRKARGQDVVVAAVQPDAPEEVTALLANLPIIPPLLHDGALAIDVAAIRKRRPAVCLIDGLAYKNPPGSANAERWQDVEDLLASGISVLTTINLQYIREKQPDVERIRGRKVSDSVPLSFIKRAEDIEIVDAPAEYCNPRSVERSNSAHDVESQLSELREIALVLVAEVIDSQLADSLRDQGIGQNYGTHERILVCVTPRSNASLMISRAKRQADRFHGDLFVAYVEQDEMSSADQQMLESNLEEARRAHAQVQILHGEDPMGAILRFAKSERITQIFVGHSLRKGWFGNLRPNPVERLILEADGMDVRIFPQSATGDQ